MLKLLTASHEEIVRFADRLVIEAAKSGKFAFPPVTDVRLPVSMSTVSALVNLTGNAYDQPLSAPGTVSNIRLRIIRLTDNTYWTGAGFSGGFSSAAISGSRAASISSQGPGSRFLLCRTPQRRSASPKHLQVRGVHCSATQ